MSFGKKGLVFLLMAVCCRTFGQAPPPETLPRSPTDTGPETVGGHLRMSLGEEFGRLERVRRISPPDPFSIFSSQSYYHIDNLFLTETNKRSANAWVGEVGGSVIPYSTYHWTPQFLVSESLVRFDRESHADYRADTIAFANRIGFDEDNLFSWDFSASGQQSEGVRTGLGQFYRRFEIGNGLNWLLPVDSGGRWFFKMTPAIAWRSAHPAFEDRLGGSLLLSGIWVARRSLQFEPFIQTGYAYYPNDSQAFGQRRDFEIASGLNLLWRIADHFSMAASGSWRGNYSSVRAADYAISPIVSLSARVGF